MIKLFACDMDGTLLNDQHVISHENAQAIKQLQQHDIEFLIATGRDWKSAQNLLSEHAIECAMINLNGAIVSTADQKTLFQHPISNQTFIEITKILESYDVIYTLSTKNHYYLSNRSAMMAYTEQQWMATNQSEDTTAAQLEAHFEDTLDISDYFYDTTDPLFKMMVISSDSEVLNACHQDLAKLTDLDITSSGPDNLELTHIQAQKGIALEQYLKLKGWTLNEAVTIGDSLNDRSMLEMCPNSYAMANAPEHIKKIAAHIAPRNSENGVAQVIHSLLN